MNKAQITAAIATAIATVGLFFLAAGFQTYGMNWIGQICVQSPFCIHPEFVAIGGGLLIAAFLFYRHYDK